VPESRDFPSEVLEEACVELDSAIDRIKHCLGQLSDAELKWRPSPSMNSIANLILHLCGNVRQWLTAGIGGCDDIRDRPKEFAQYVDGMTTNELTQRLEASVEEAKQAMRNSASAELLSIRRIQGWEVTGLRALFDSVCHFRGHTQEIIHMTRCQLGVRYEFAFVPATPEEGAGS